MAAPGVLCSRRLQPTAPGGKGPAHLSGSNCSKTLRFVWSRMLRILVKQPRSNFLARNIDMVCGLVVAIDGERSLVRAAIRRLGPIPIFSRHSSDYLQL